ncbi:MAG: response regulator transcription factor [Thermoleophilaceae bacterium]
MRVLLVEEESPAREALRRALLLAGADVLVASEGRQAIEQARDDQPDAVLLSSDLPDMDCLWACRRLREPEDAPPILVLSDGDSVSALNAGADDHRPRHISVGELYARLRALTRRQTNGSANGTPLGFCELELFTEAHEARIGGRTVRLTRTEFDLLHLFMRNPRRVMTHDVIYERVWGYDFALAGNALRVYVGYLRRKLEEGGERRLIHTVRGVGYVLREP